VTHAAPIIKYTSCLPDLPAAPGVAQVGQDPRPVMRAAYACFRDASPPEAILAAAEPARGSHDTFYARLVSVCPPLGCIACLQPEMFSKAMHDPQTRMHFLHLPCFRLPPACPRSVLAAARLPVH